MMPPPGLRRRVSLTFDLLTWPQSWSFHSLPRGPRMPICSN